MGNLVSTHFLPIANILYSLRMQIPPWNLSLKSLAVERMKAQSLTYPPAPRETRFRQYSAMYNFVRSEI